MTPAQLKNLGMYALAALVGALVATGLHLAQILEGTDPVIWRPLAATFTQSFFGALATALGASQLTRIGSEGLAHQVNTLRDMGFSRKDLTVVPSDTIARNGTPVIGTEVRMGPKPSVADEIVDAAELREDG